MPLVRVGSRVFDPAAIVVVEVEGDDGGGKPQTLRIGLSNGTTLEFKDAEAGIVWDGIRRLNMIDDWVNPPPFKGLHHSPTAP
jgi:hypothetical protein